MTCRFQISKMTNRFSTWLDSVDKKTLPFWSEVDYLGSALDTRRPFFAKVALSAVDGMTVWITNFVVLWTESLTRAEVETRLKVSDRSPIVVDIMHSGGVAGPKSKLGSGRGRHDERNQRSFIGSAPFGENERTWQIGRSKATEDRIQDEVRRLTIEMGDQIGNIKPGGGMSSKILALTRTGLNADLPGFSFSIN